MSFGKKIILLILLFGQFNIYSQIEVRTYPFALEDMTTLRYSIDYFDKSEVLKTGAHLFWDLNDNQTPLFEEIIIKKNNNPGFYNKPIYEVSNIKSSVFYSKYGRNFDEIGFVLNTKIQSHTVIYDKPLYFTTKNLKYGATFSNKSSFTVSLIREELPDELTNKLPESVKEIQLVGRITRKYHCDAAGRFGLNGENISALRLNVDEKIELKLYDISSGNAIPFIDEDILRKIYTKAGENKYYLFFSNEYKFYFAKILYDKVFGNYIIKYQTNDTTNKILEVNTNKKTFLIYPNPTYSIAKMLISNYGTGNYKLEIYNIIGKKVWENDIHLSKRNLLRFDFSSLRKGTYIVALKDKYGKLITTRKLVIISV